MNIDISASRNLFIETSFMFVESIHIHQIHNTHKAISPVSLPDYPAEDHISLDASTTMMQPSKLTRGTNKNLPVETLFWRLHLLNFLLNLSMHNLEKNEKIIVKSTSKG